MQVKYLNHNNIDKNKWDKCIAKSFNGIIYGFSWYLDAVCTWDALVNDDYTTIMPLPYNKKAGIFYIYQPPFTQQLGVFSTQQLTPNIINKYLNAIPKHFKLIEYNLNSFNKPTLKTFKTKWHNNYELDLILPYNIAKQNYSKNTKRNLKKAEKRKISIVKENKPEKVIRLFKENRGKNIKTLKDTDYTILKKLMYRLIYLRAGQVWIAYDEKNRICAGMCVVNSHNKIIFLFSGINAIGKQAGAMFKLINELVEYNSQKLMTLDFEGSNDENLARFYSGFGAVCCKYPFVYKNNLPFFIKIAKQVLTRFV